MDPEAKRVISFWFDRNPMEWIFAPDGLDAQMNAEFGDLVQRARRDELDDWIADPEGGLALVVLLDRFSRNLYCGSAEAFGGDAKAGDVATRAVARGFDKQVTVFQASAFYLALLQQESLISGVAASCLFEALKPRCETVEEHVWVDMAIAASKGHVQQLERFGRYPTRNALLGRKNTEAEEEFLKEHKPSLK
ncbi:hypothetical protein F4821DRAFT_81903 [Hypoxylon rubiginosum]|uniref:Uncharacterized protein n=1 Tax=Hypoxylon rubiginosum TaxID=110542 RepID=A0ACC0D7S1_9PEZI|nr:hypothetical protein F4821DRAFT_81903 [Hypoxylon rubiginosum]